MDKKTIKTQTNLYALGGVLGVLAVAIPATSLVTLPVLGVIMLKPLAAAASAFFIGWATRTPGHVPAPPSADSLADILTRDKTPPTKPGG